MDKSKQDDIDAMKLRARDDTTSLLARYGTMSALASAAGASSAGSPLLRPGG